MKRTKKLGNTADSPLETEKQPKTDECKEGHAGGGRVGRVCEICSHPRRLDWDREILRGGNCSRIARKIGVGVHTVYNHRDRHLTRQLMKSAEIRELTMVETIATDVSSVYGRIMDLLQKAERKQRAGLFLQCCQELRAYAEFLLRMQATFERIQQDETNRPCSCGNEPVKFDVSKVDDFTLQRLFKELVKARTEEGKPIATAPVRDTLH